MADTVKRSSFLTALVDPIQPTASRSESTYAFKGGALGWTTIPFLIGAALLVVSAIGWVVDPHQFYFSYLVGWTFCLSVTLGSMFFVIINHLTKAYWVVALRRIPEVLMYAFPILAILFIPIIFGMHDLYHWTHEAVYDPASPEYDAILAGKEAYLNIPFYLIRIALYFIAWTTVSYKLYKLSIRQDVDPDPEIPAQQRRVSAWGLPLFAITVAFAGYDLLMSLDPHWFSTMFGVYFFGGSFLSGLCLVTLLTILLQKRGEMLTHTVTKEHYQDLGKLIFGFVVFWAYIAFSQYMLIWYANIPEETVWFRHRMEHGWQYNSAALLFLHFILPFLILLPRATKRMIPVMSIMMVWLLIMQWFDLHWLSMPVLHEHATFHWLDFTTWLGLFLVLISAFTWRLSRHPLVPQNDPLLPKSLHFENT